jgi:phosphoenolpyruvate-protein phosphotransferase
MEYPFNRMGELKMSPVHNNSDNPMEWETSGEVTVISRNGFHARPAAILTRTAKKFSSDVKLVKNDRTANAKSLVAVMSFALQKGDTVVVAAKGDDAKEAVEALVPIITGNAENNQEREQERTLDEMSIPDADDSENKNVFHGITASPGIAVGMAKRIVRGEIDVKENSAGSPMDEERELQKAIEEAKSQMKIIKRDTETTMDAEHSAIFGAHIELLEDPELMGYALKLISIGHSAAYAWKSSIEAHAKRLRGLCNELFAERANDLDDVGGRVLRILTGVAPEDIEYIQNSVILALDLTPSDTAAFGGRVRGFCTVRGGATGHISMLARSLELPALVGMDESMLTIPDGSPLILNADEGVLKVDPDAGEIERVRRKQAGLAERHATNVQNAAKPAVTSDGVRITVAANIGGISDANYAVSMGCDGVGLLRSEFLFLGRDTAPGVDELADAYVEIARLIGRENPLVIRTIDIGGDKSTPYINRDAEENPFLGVRGLRLSLRMKDLFEAQLKAILRAAEFCDLHIMFPMVSTLEEFREAKAFVRDLQRETGMENVKIGLMAEVPSSAILARHFAIEADFMSLGTNDLTQYTMAADRGNPKLSRIADGLDPAVIAMIKSVVDGARGQSCWVGVCGGIAEDPLAIPALIGLGVDELSVSVPVAPQIKSIVRGLSKAACGEVASRILDFATATEVREYLKSVKI